MIHYEYCYYVIKLGEILCSTTFKTFAEDYAKKVDGYIIEEKLC